MKELGLVLAPVVLVLLASQGATGDLADVDQADLNSDSSGTRGMDNHLEGGEGSDPNLVNPQKGQGMDNHLEGGEGSDPNLVNPQKGQGYGLPMDPNVLNNPWKGTTQAPRRTSPPTPKRTFSEQSLRAVLELGIIIGVAFLVGGLFMAMVGIELLCDKVSDKYREIFKKPKELPDIERLHPAELVGTFSRYK